jgi:tRNA (adenine57-N1/adenine58-N1)-methyltransferase
MTKHLKRGPFIEGDKVQLTGPKGRMNTITLVAGAAFGTHRGDMRHDDIIGNLKARWSKTNTGLNIWRYDHC